MIRHDVRCDSCEREQDDYIFVGEVTDPLPCPFPDCDGQARIFYGARSRNAQWGDRAACVVYKDAAGNIRYPMRNDEPTPKDCERVEIRSMAEMARFEKAHGVTNETRHFDHGEWRGLESLPGYDGKPIGPLRGDRGR